MQLLTSVTQIAAERTKRSEVKDQAETMDRRLSVSQAMNARRQSFTGGAGGAEPKMPRRSSMMLEQLPPPPPADNDAELRRLRQLLEETTRQLNDLRGRRRREEEEEESCMMYACVCPGETLAHDLCTQPRTMLCRKSLTRCKRRTGSWNRSGTWL
jgi:signal transduction protein with GAF and PtsI domain